MQQTKRDWQADELVEHWTPLPDELILLTNKTNPNRPGFALLLKFFRLEARFPYNKHEVTFEELFAGRNLGKLVIKVS